MSKTSCPNCGYIRFWRIRRNKNKCKKCRYEYSPKVYPVKGIRSTANEWRVCVKFFLLIRTIKGVTRETGLGQSRVEKMIKVLREVMLEDVPGRFSGTTEIDETYIGGQRKNKKLHIRKLSPPKRGHGTDKIPILGLFNRKSGQVYLKIIDRKKKGRGTKIHRIFDVIKEKTYEGSVIYSDSYELYINLSKYHNCEHHSINHHQGEYSRGDVHTNNIEGFWGILKRKLGCVGGVQRKNYKYFIAEIVWKFNHRKLSINEQVEILMNKTKRFGG